LSDNGLSLPPEKYKLKWREKVVSISFCRERSLGSGRTCPKWLGVPLWKLGTKLGLQGEKIFDRWGGHWARRISRAKGWRREAWDCLGNAELPNQTAANDANKEEAERNQVCSIQHVSPGEHAVGAK
jgi:hypothetical protein